MFSFSRDYLSMKITVKENVRLHLSFMFAKNERDEF